MECTGCGKRLTREEAKVHWKECEGAMEYPEHLQFPDPGEYGEFVEWLEEFRHLCKRRKRYRKRKVT